MKKDNTSKNWWIIGGVFFLLVIALCLINYFYLPKIISEPSARGAFGDSFGAINALFSGLAFVGLIVAILLQKEELKLQREELKETRKEFTEQNKTLKQQRFETTFFNMLSLHNEIIQNIILGENKGRDAIKIIYHFLSKNWTTDQAQNIPKGMTEVYQSMYKDRQHLLGHYFRNLYRIFYFINKSKVRDKKSYAKIVRAQLSDQELALLFYNCYFFYKGKNFKILAEKYDLFDNLNSEQLLDSEHGPLITRFEKKK